MPDLTTIQTNVNIGKAYYIQLLATQLATLKKGYGSVKPLLPLKRVIQALTFQLNANINDSSTTSLYNCLIRLLQGFSGAYVLDPNVVVPGQTPIIIVPYEPLTLTYSQADLIEDGAGSGNWYLPLTNAPNRVPVLVTSNGESFNGRYDTNFLIKRYYGFANNDTQVIKATFI